MKDFLNVAVYRRCSIDSINQIGSFELMKAYYEAFVKSRPKWQLAGFYTDEEDGKNGLAKLLKDCEDGKIDLIVTKNISKFAENMADSMRIIRRLKNLDPPVGIYFECEDLNTLDDDADKWLLQWMMVF